MVFPRLQYVPSDHFCWCRAFCQEGLGQPPSTALPISNEHGKMDLLHNICADCPFVSSTKLELEQHALNAGHLSFPCICGAKFARSFCLTRHINSNTGLRFSCGLCDDKSFPRSDKLDDHLRRWHRLGDKAFSQYKGGSSSSNSASLPTGGHPVVPAESAGQLYFPQIYPPAPGFAPVPTHNGFPSVSITASNASSVASSASLGSSIVSMNSGPRMKNSPS